MRIYTVVLHDHTTTTEGVKREFTFPADDVDVDVAGEVSEHSEAGKIVCFYNFVVHLDDDNDVTVASFNFDDVLAVTSIPKEEAES